MVCKREMVGECGECVSLCVCVCARERERDCVSCLYLAGLRPLESSS